MTNYFYHEDFQEIPKNKKRREQKHEGVWPSKLSLRLILGYGAALSVIESKSLGNVEILLN